MKSPSHAYTDLHTSLAAGATLLTANRRLANRIVQEYEQEQLSKQKKHWLRPDVLPLTSWLIRSWEIQSEQHQNWLLSDYQALLIWERLIEDSRLGLLNRRATAELALQAWQLAHLWELPWQQHQAEHADFDIWRTWAQQFQNYCQQHHCTDSSQLATWLAHNSPQSADDWPKILRLVGLDVVPTAVQRLLTQLKQNGVQIQQSTPQQSKSCITTLALADTDSELRHMIAWLQQSIAQQPQAKFACIVPNLPELRPKISRLLQQSFYPTDCLHNRVVYQPLYDISAGQSLLHCNVTHCAWLILRLALTQTSINDLGLLLRSPYLAASDEEASTRAHIDASLRELGHESLDLTTLIAYCQQHKANGLHTHCPRLAEKLQQLQTLIASFSQKASSRLWAERFAQQLQSLGWPGSRPLDSHDYQIVERLQAAFSEFAAMDNLLGDLSLGQALYQWQQLVQATVFQFQVQTPRIFILGALEAVGLQFDGTWIMGLHDAAWPQRVQPNPFLPLSAQRAANLPQSSAHRELLFTQQLTQHLLHSAPKVWISYPQTEGDNPLNPSTVLANYPKGAPPATPTNLMQQLNTGSTLNQCLDRQAPALKNDERARGGSGLLKLQAACPFRAFASLRLHAQSLNEPQPGLDPLARGRLVHRCLELIWKTLTCQTSLLRLSDTACHTLIQQKVDQALDEEISRNKRKLPKTLLALEKNRLQALLQQWLDLEKQRPDFTVLATEQRQQIQLADLSLNVMIDRIDSIGHDRIIIDYKTGHTALTAWDGPRPEEPQLPLYCIASHEPIHGIVIAELRGQKLQFKGLLEHPELLPGSHESQTNNNDETPAWQALQNEWHDTLQRLAHDFVQGVATVSPKSSASCTYCDLDALCRIGESHD